MKRKTLIISTSAAALFCIMVFTFAQRSTHAPDSEDINQNASLQGDSVQIYRPVITADPEPPEATETPVIYYSLQSDGNLLKLYEVNGDTKKAVKSVPFNPEMFPAEDRQLLEKGIKANTLEEGIETMENFVS